MRPIAAGELDRRYSTHTSQVSSPLISKLRLLLSAMTLHCAVRNDITLLGFRMSESLEHTLLA